MIRLAIGLFFILLPFLELILLVKTSQAIGFWTTLTLMVGAAIAGGMVLTQQSASAFRQALEATSRGETPHEAVLDGLFLMVAGVLLVVPGLITDVMGLLLLIPPVRRWVAHQAVAGVIRGTGPLDDRPADEKGPQPQRPDPFGTRPGGPKGGPVIEGEFERLDERPPGAGRHRDDQAR